MDHVVRKDGEEEREGGEETGEAVETAEGKVPKVPATSVAKSGRAKRRRVRIGLGWVKGGFMRLD